MRIIKLLFLLLLPLGLLAQNINKPVKWQQELKELGNNEYLLTAKGEIAKGWHLYSIKHPDGGIGIPANFEIVEPNPNVEQIGKPQEIGNLKEVYSELFEQDEKYLEQTVEYALKVKLKSTNAKVKTEVSWQVCDDERCLPPDFKELTFDLKSNQPKETAANPPPTEPQNTEQDAQQKKDSLLAANTSNSNLFNQDSVTSNNNTTTDSLVLTANPSGVGYECKTYNQNLYKGGNNNKKNSLSTIFILGFLGGLAALLMPCIFPMIPLTVSMFTKQSKTRSAGIQKAFIFGFSIVLIYVVLGLLFTSILGASGLNELATNPMVNIGFFIVFVIFALSFFGAFELTLPSNWLNFADKGADRGGLIGVFFMAFTLALVSFSCTGPIIGSLLVGAATESNYFALVMGMLGFSSALAIPFTLFAIFPSWLNSLPKSGGWLNTIKVSLGFIELAFAFKFLSNADLVWQMHWLEREVFLAIWIAIGIALALYLLGKFKFRTDSDLPFLGIGRVLFALLVMAFTTYLIPGLFGAPLNLLSGLTPPLNYSESPYGFHDNANNQLPNNMVAGPHRIPVFKDFNQAADYAKKVNKPMLLDFTGFACANCRKVEDLVWSDPTIKRALANDVILVSLYVDDRKELKEEQKIYNPILERKLRTVGDLWTAFEIEHFKANAQPYYVIVDACLNRYNQPLEAEYNKQTYLQWLELGIDNYYQEHPKN